MAKGGNKIFDHLISINDSTADAVVCINDKGILLAWNKAAEKMFQHSSETMIGENISIIIPDKFRDLHHKGIARVNSGGERHVIGKPVQLAGLKKDGTEFPVELTLSAWEQDNKMFYGGIIRDITGRLKMEEVLRDSERRFRSILESANDCIVTADARGNILSWNKAAADIFGFTEDETIGNPLHMIVPEKYKELHEKGISRVSGGGAQHVIGKTVELVGLHKDGHEFPIELTLSTWLQGDERYYSGIIRNITERLKMEEGLKDSERRFRSILESANDCIVTADARGNILSWNKAAADIFGFTEDETIGKPLNMIVPEKYKELHEKGIARVSGGGDQHVIGKTVELIGLHKNGYEFPIELTLSTWTQGLQRFYSGIIRDITQRLKMEEVLRDSESRFRSILESANDCIVTADAKGIILSWNKAASNIFGFSADETIGKPLNMIVPEKYKALHEKGIARVSSGGDQHVIGKTVELIGLHKDRHEFPIELTLSTWTQGNQRFYSGIIRDITQRLKMEEGLKDSERRFRSILESANDCIVTANSRGYIVSWNKAAANVFGFAENEAIGNPLNMIVPEKFKALHEKGIARVSGGGDQHVIGKTVELVGLHKDGHEFPIELTLSTWLQGDERFYSGIIRDITDRKEYEQKLIFHQEELKEKADELRLLNLEVSSKNEQLQGLSNKLAKYLSRQVYTSIFEGDKDVKIESYRKKLTIFFSDIEGFTELTEQVESEVLTAALNKYLNEMAKIALDFGGTIDKYIGDAIMIFFGDPETLGEKQDAVACVKMAIQMRKQLLEMRKEWGVLGVSKPLNIRMGVNTGFCTVGNFGSEERLDYTIVGGAVNLASRLEGAASVNGILISDATHELIKDEIQCEFNGEIKVKGIPYPIKTYTVLDSIDSLEKEKRHIEAQLKGFNLSINFNELDYADKLYAKELLEKAMAKLK